MNRLLLVAVLACGALANGGASAQDAAAGEKIYKAVCKNCHGPTGKGMSAYPRLAGRSAEYLTQRLMTYRAGEKIGPNSLLMIPHAKKLSDADIANVVAHISTLE